MSGAFSYLLRPGKFVDRALFIELLQYVDRSVNLRDAVYVGLGGPCMEDHRIIHNTLGLKKMISVERDDAVFRQQRFNRPLREIVCVKRDASAFVDEFAAEMARAKVRENSRLIVWLDYEAPDELMIQLQTVQSLINLVNDGDVLRVTLNAHAGSLGNHREGDSEEALQARRTHNLEARFGEFLPDGIHPQDTQNARYPNVVLEALKLAVMRTTGHSGRTFLPLLIVHYSDGQPMLTVTGIVLPDEDVAAFLKSARLQSWTHYAKDWTNVERVSKAPQLTLRETMLVDQAIMRGRPRLPKKLDYLTHIQRLSAAEIVTLYRRYQRFFPQFQNVEL